MTPVSVAVGRRDLRLALSGAAGLNTVLDLTVDGTVYPAIVKELQRHPVRRTVTHVDFIQVNLDEEITVSVPLRLEGEATAVANGGGLVDPAVDSIEVTTTPRSIPDEFVVDISGMQMDTVIRLSDIPMPAGVTATGDPDSPVVTVLTMRAEVAEIEAADAEVAEEQAEEAEAAEGGEAADGERRRRRRGRRRAPSEAQDPVRLADRRTGQPGQGLRPHPAQRRPGGRRRAGPPPRRHAEVRAATTPSWPSAGSATERAVLGLPADVHERLGPGRAGPRAPLRHRGPDPHRRRAGRARPAADDRAGQGRRWPGRPQRAAQHRPAPRHPGLPARPHRRRQAAGGKERGANHVLGRMPAKQREEYDVAVQEAADAVELIVTEGVDAAMRRYNVRDAGG